MLLESPSIPKRGQEAANKRGISIPKILHMRKDPPGVSPKRFGCFAQTLRLFGPNASGVSPKRSERLVFLCSFGVVFRSRLLFLFSSSSLPPSFFFFIFFFIKGCRGKSFFFSFRFFLLDFSEDFRQFFAHSSQCSTTSVPPLLQAS